MNQHPRNNGNLRGKCKCCIICYQPFSGIKNVNNMAPPAVIVHHFQLHHPYFLLPSPNQPRGFLHTWNNLVFTVNILGGVNSQLYQAHMRVNALHQQFITTYLHQGYADGQKAALEQRATLQKISDVPSLLQPHPPTTRQMAATSVPFEPNMENVSSFTVTSTTTASPNSGIHFLHELCYDKPPRANVSHRRKRRLVEHVLQSPRLSWLLRKDCPISRFHSKKPLKMSGSPSFGTNYNHNEPDKVPPGFNRMTTEQRIMTFENIANVIVWLDVVTLYPNISVAFGKRTIIVRRKNGSAPTIVHFPQVGDDSNGDREKNKNKDDNVDEDTSFPRIFLAPGDALDVKFELHHLVPLGSHYQWVLLHFSYYDLEASQRATVSDHGPAQQLGIDLMDYHVKHFLSGTAFQTNIVKPPITLNVNDGHSDTANTAVLNPHASSFMFSVNLTVFKSKKSLTIDDPQRSEKIRSAVEGAKVGFPNSWKAWKIYHAQQEWLHHHHASTVLQNAVQSREVLFTQRLKATFSLAEEFNYVRAEVANACHSWNKLYMHRVIRRDYGPEEGSNSIQPSVFSNHKELHNAYTTSQLSMLNVEELRQRSDMLGYDMHNAVSLRVHEKSPHVAVLHVPGVAHQRPPVMENMQLRFRFQPKDLWPTMSSQLESNVRQKVFNVGTNFSISELNSTVEWVEFTGFVMNVNNTREEVTLSLPSLDSENYDANFRSLLFERSAPVLHVRFPFQGGPHFAAMRLAVVRCAEKFPRLLFPDVYAESQRTEEHCLTSAALIEDIKRTTKWIDRDLNPTQQRAVAAVLASWVDTKSATKETDERPHKMLSHGADVIDNDEKELKDTDEIIHRPILCVLGPPGTGKTRTLMEVVLQLVRKPGSKLLLCAPSPVAADIICKRLSPHFAGWHKTTDDNRPRMLRLNAVNRPRHWVVMPETFKFCIPDGSSFGLPSWLELSDPTLSVIVSTCAMSSFIAHSIKEGKESSGLNKGFDYVLIDEAAQAVEAEALIAVQCAHSLSPRVVLFGDSLQLGPQVRSPVSEAQGLGMSLLERLTRTNMYGRAGAPFSNNATAQGGSSAATFTGETKTASVTKAINIDPMLVTHLKFNYRSHVDILSVSNDLFYGGKLKACGDPKVTDSLCSWTPSANLLESQVQHKSCPLWVIGIEGQDAHEIDSPSFYNDAEVEAVVSVVDQLLSPSTNNNQIHVVADDLGIIAPYWKQVRKIRDALRLRNYGSVRVGLVEDYQGQESRVTIIATTLTRPRRANISFMNDGDGEDEPVSIRIRCMYIFFLFALLL